MSPDSGMPPAGVPPHTIIVYASKVRVALWTLGALAVGGIGVFEIVHPGGASPLLTIGADIIVAAACALAVATGIAILASAKPRLIINGEGIWINSRVLGVPFIHWNGIAMLIAQRRYTQTLLLIVLVDPEAVFAQQTWLQRLAYMLLKGDISGRLRMITTSDAFFTMSTEEIVQRIQEQFHHELAQHGIRILTKGKAKP